MYIDFMSTFPFDQPRKGQVHAIESILRGVIAENKTHHIVVGPTGSGKSAIAIALARWFHRYMVQEEVTNSQINKRGAAHAAAWLIAQYRSGAEAPIEDTQSTKEEGNITSGVARLVREADTAWSKMIIATPRKQLQDQYEAEFGKEPDV